MQRPARRFGIALSGGSERRLGVEMMPGADHALARRDTVEAGGHQRLGGEPAGGDFLRRGAGREGERVGHQSLRRERAWRESYSAPGERGSACG